MDQRIELTDRLIAAINEVRDATREVKNAIYNLSTYTKYVTFDGESVVNSAGVAGLLGILDASGLVGSVVEVAGATGVLEVDGIYGAVAEVAGASGLMESDRELSGDAAAIANTPDVLLKDVTRKLAGISGSVSTCESVEFWRQGTDFLAGVIQNHSTVIGWMIDP